MTDTPTLEKNMNKPIICIDFDGVVHSYERGWQNGAIYGYVVPGFFSWASIAQKHFKLVIYSARSSTEEGKAAMKEWLAKKLLEWGGEPIELEFSSEKPHAHLTIDDRAIQFNGNWKALDLRIDALLDFEPWTKK